MARLKMFGSILAEVFLITFCSIFSETLAVKWCHPSSFESHPELASRIKQDSLRQYLKTACYFEVADIKRKSVISTDNYKKFSIEKAREVCKEFFATLPTIYTQAENNFARDLGGDVVLGVKVRLPVVPEDEGLTNETFKPTIEKWDDGSPPGFVPQTWRYPDVEPAETFTVVTPDVEGGWETLDAEDQDNNFDNTRIYCKQLYTPYTSSAISFTNSLTFSNICAASAIGRALMTVVH